jgi:2-keto-4-pentenoate hydratase/2-oxohepta-3-ene-1,7-dioic acid hydratase in catechol pathway
MDRELPDWPTFFTKATETVIGPYDDIRYDAALSTRMDYEGELAVVVGARGRSIPEGSALDHVLGYVVANDITARDIQRRHGGQWTKGKSIDGTCPVGPWIVTRDEIADPQALELECFVNGERRQRRSTADMAFSVARLISELSLGMTLLPGDIILTGTPEGVGYPQERWLRPGDQVVTSLSGLGTLVNAVKQATLTSYER